jgi:hypothetical protein
MVPINRLQKEHTLHANEQPPPRVSHTSEVTQSIISKQLLTLLLQLLLSLLLQYCYRYYHLMLLLLLLLMMTEDFP